MQDIDFLPDQYRRKHMRRRSQPWRVVVIALFVALLMTAVFAQHRRKQNAEDELAALLPEYDLAMSQNRQLAEISSQLQTVDSSAELCTYLRHPWPHTQLLAALLAPLPDEITFERLQITCESRQPPARTQRRSFSERKAEEDELADLPPAARDLKQFRERCDKTETVIRISGTTSRSSALHRYLSALGNARLFSGVELESIESVDSRGLEGLGGTLKFDAAAVVRPGYGQPGGPTAPETDAVAQNGPKSNRPEAQ